MPDPENLNDPQTEPAQDLEPSEDPGSIEPTVTLSKDDIAEMMKESAASAVQAALAAQPQPTVAEPAPRPQPVADDPLASIGDDDLLEGRSLKYLKSNVDQRFGNLETAAMQLYSTNVDNLLSNAELRHPQVFEKWGKEIKEIVDEQRQNRIVSATDIQEAIERVRARHIDEIAEERAKQMLNNMPVTEGIGESSVMGDGVDESQEIPEAWQAIFKEHGITNDMARRRCADSNISMKKYVEMMQNHQIVRDGPNKYVSYDLDKGVKSSG